MLHVRKVLKSMFGSKSKAIFKDIFSNIERDLSLAKLYVDSASEEDLKDLDTLSSYNYLSPPVLKVNMPTYVEMYLISKGLSIPSKTRVSECILKGRKINLTYNTHTVLLITEINRMQEHDGWKSLENKTGLMKRIDISAEDYMRKEFEMFKE